MSKGKSEKWEAVSDVAEFMSRQGTKRTRVHAFNHKVCHWSYCGQCGLVLLRNDVSRRSAKAPCVTYE